MKITRNKLNNGAATSGGLDVNAAANDGLTANVTVADESALIARARDGDADAFCSLYGLYRDRLYRYAFYRLRSAADAEDAVAECVLSAWKQIGSLRQPEAFPGWIFRILAGACSRLIKEQVKHREQIANEQSESVVNTRSAVTTNASVDSDTCLMLREALGQLSDEERNIVLLSAVGGLKSQEIAELTGKPSGTIRSTLSRSLKKVRGYFE